MHFDPGQDSPITPEKHAAVFSARVEESIEVGAGIEPAFPHEGEHVCALTGRSSQISSQYLEGLGGFRLRKPAILGAETI
jgi:hypothetical protein